MKIKNIIAATIIALSSFTLNAQTNKFIEIAAADTIQLKPVEFVYQIATGNEMSFMQMKADKQEKDPEISIAVIKKILDKNNFVYEVKGKQNFRITPDKTSDSSIYVFLKSDAELKRLYKLLLTVKGISGNISDIKYESISPYKPEIYQRLYKQALADATILATISGNGVGQLISVQEPKESDFMSNYMDTLKQMSGSNNMFSEIFGFENSLIQKIEKKLLFRFEIK
ncbi:MAG TPA: hypothetical protein VGQ04_03280 [Chitinophagaceae bacterium]|nr:hypothetical protein [Chitinophagaceae bacterium]